VPGSMTIPPPPENQSQVQPVAPDTGVEIALHSFWEKNRTLLIGACVVALLVIIGREGWQYFADSREQEVRKEYARIADRPEQLAAFAGANADHVLAGVAYLQLADAKFTAADYKSAAENYKKAAGVIKEPVLFGRAKMGEAISILNSGDQSGAEAALKALVADASLLKAVRAEAAYHLATLADGAGNTTEVGRLVAEINKIDATGVWAQLATSLMSPKSQL
jgi:predicted negative regulator of RcsB-dependent stress response